MRLFLSVGELLDMPRKTRSAFHFASGLRKRQSNPGLNPSNSRRIIQLQNFALLSHSSESTISIFSCYEVFTFYCMSDCCILWYGRKQMFIWVISCLKYIWLSFSLGLPRVSDQNSKIVCLNSKLQNEGLLVDFRQFTVHWTKISCWGHTKTKSGYRYIVYCNGVPLSAIKGDVAYYFDWGVHNVICFF